MLVNLQKPSGLNLSKQLQLVLPKQGDWTMWSAEVPFSFHHSVIKLKTEKMKAIFEKSVWLKWRCCHVCNSVVVFGYPRILHCSHQDLTEEPFSYILVGTL